MKSRLILILLLMGLFACETATEPEKNQAPVISSLTITETVLAPGEGTNLLCTAVDPDENDLTYTWECSGGTLSASGFSAYWAAPDTMGHYSITCMVDDGNGGQDIGTLGVFVEGVADGQIMFVYADHDDYYYDYETGDDLEIENTSVGGVVFADPFPAFDYLKLNSVSFVGDEYARPYLGYVSFGDFDGDGNAMITSGFSPLTVEIKTSIGTVSGAINLPQELAYLTLSEYTSLALGEPFTISWAGNADFYAVECEYEYRDQNGYWHWDYLEEFVTGNSITFPGSIFTHDGYLEYIRVEPINGPIPEAGVSGNMTGDGQGYLFYMNDRIYYDENIEVGDGYYSLQKRPTPQRLSEAELSLQTRKRLERKIHQFQGTEKPD